jgi:hypothetical protein
VSPQQAQRAEVRIGDSEREHAVSALGEHYLAGRITKEEYDERAAAAWTAKTASQLQPLFWDLPVQQKPAPQQPPKQQRSRSRTRRRGVPFPLLVGVVVLLAVLGVPWWGWLILAWIALASVGRSACR